MRRPVWKSSGDWPEAVHSATADLAIDGSDLMEIGIPAGPAIGTVLRRLLELVIEDPSRNTREFLLAEARQTAR